MKEKIIFPTNIPAQCPSVILSYLYCLLSLFDKCKYVNLVNGTTVLKSEPRQLATRTHSFQKHLGLKCDKIDAVAVALHISQFFAEWYAKFNTVQQISNYTL
jgi:hypothetical protein